MINLYFGQGYININLMPDILSRNFPGYSSPKVLIAFLPMQSDILIIFIYRPTKLYLIVFIFSTSANAR